MTTLHLESGLAGLLVTINMADEGVAGKGKDSGCGREKERCLSFLKSRFTFACVYFGKGNTFMFWKQIHLGSLLSTDGKRVTPRWNFTSIYSRCPT